MINQVIESLNMLRGLSPTAPLFLAVDGLPSPTPNDAERLAQYVAKLNATWEDRSHVTIIASDAHLHIAGNVKQAMDLVKTNYVCVTT